MSKPKIKITQVDRIGKYGCHRGHKIGDTFDYDTDRSKSSTRLCMWLFRTLTSSDTAAHRYFLNEMNQNMGGYDHYSYLIPYPGLRSINLNNQNETNQKSTDFRGYILPTKDLWLLRFT